MLNSCLSLWTKNVFFYITNKFQFFAWEFVIPTKSYCGVISQIFMNSRRKKQFLLQFCEPDKIFAIWCENFKLAGTEGLKDFYL